ncbi:MAG: methyltransferase domain-containing protein [bacterium]
MNANSNSALPSAPPGSGVDAMDWEERYRTGDTPWEKGFAAPPLTDLLTRHAIRGTVLVPGCGSGHDVRAMASQGASVLGLDIAESAIISARSFQRAGGESYEQGDLFALPASWYGRFDWVVEHTCFCAISPCRRTDYLRAVNEVLKPNGHYFGIFYLNPDTEEGPPFRVSREEIARFFDPNFDLLEEWIPEHSFEGRVGRELCQLRRKRS